MTPPAHVPSERLRDTMRTWATGVSVVVSRSPDGRVAARTANSVTAVSQAPPLVSWCPDLDSVSRDVHIEAEAFTISILARDQLDLCWHFARSGGDKLADIALVPGPLGIPLLDGAAGHLACRTWARYPGGDHMIVVGEVVHALTHRTDVLVMAAGRPASAVPLDTADMPIT